MPHKKPITPTATTRAAVRARPFLTSAVGLAVALFIFSLILLNRSPNLLRAMSMQARTGFGLTVPVVGVVLYLLFIVRGRIGEALSLWATMALFALSLAGLWASGQSQTGVVSGLVPLTDAGTYYADALRILSGREVTALSGMRPIFPAVLSMLLAFARGNLMTALAVLAALNGFAGFVAARTLRKTHGAAPAAFFLTMFFLFFRHHSGMVVSEALALPVAASGLSLLWSAASSRETWRLLVGVLISALALVIRPGAMFVLPALLLWGAWLTRGKARLSVRFLGVGLVIVTAVFLANSLVIRPLAGEHAAAFSNFSWALYGLAAGGENWSHVFDVHPEVLGLSEPEQSRQIYKLAIQLMLQEPELVIRGALHHWSAFFSASWYNVFSFVAGADAFPRRIVRWGLYGLSGLGIWSFLRDRHNPQAALVVIAALAVLASVPFVPPTDAYRVRLYAATIPLLCALPTLGVGLVVDRLGAGRPLPTNADAQGTATALAFGGLLLLVTLAGPIFALSAGVPEAVPVTPCQAATESILIRYSEGTYVHVIRPGVVRLDWMPWFHEGHFRRSVHAIADLRLVSVLTALKAPFTLLYAMDLESGADGLVAAPTGQLPNPGTTLRLCGRWNLDLGRGSRFFQAESVVLSTARPVH